MYKIISTIIHLLVEIMFCCKMVKKSNIFWEHITMYNVNASVDSSLYHIKKIWLEICNCHDHNYVHWLLYDINKVRQRSAQIILFLFVEMYWFKCQMSKILLFILLLLIIIMRYIVIEIVGTFGHILICIFYLHVNVYKMTLINQ